MELLGAIFLGILQGATEFLPISSSAHLALAEFLFDQQQAGLVFDVALHLGTLAAILGYFKNDFLAMIQSVAAGLAGNTQTGGEQRQLALMLVLGTLPGVGAALLLADTAETVFRHPAIIAAALAVFGLLLLVADRKGKKNRQFSSLRLTDALIIGCAQAIALIPGVSRSGITITAGLMLGLDRQAAARFSFLLSAPIILGAGVYHIPAIIKLPQIDQQLYYYGAGFLAALVAGYGFIAFLMKYLQHRNFAVFAYYRFLLAAVIASLLILGK